MLSSKQTCPEYAAVVATRVLREATMTKTPKKWKNPDRCWTRYKIANEGVSSWREEGGEMPAGRWSDGSEPDSLFTKTYEKKQRTWSPPAHKYLWMEARQKIPHTCCPSRSLYDKINQFHQVNQYFWEQSKLLSQSQSEFLSEHQLSTPGRMAVKWYILPLTFPTENTFQVI